MAKIAIVRPLMPDPRFHFDRSIELSKHFEIVWICGWMKYEHYSFDDYQILNHRIEVLRKSAYRGKFKGLWDELKFLVAATKLLKNENPELTIVHSSRLALLYPILINKNQKYILKLSTTSVSTSKYKNLIWNTWGLITRFFHHNFIVDDPKMIDSFRIQKSKTAYVFEWGMKPITRNLKKFVSIRMLYIGVMGPSRRIEDTLYGLSLFLTKNPNIEISYDIIGKAKPDEERLLLDTIKNLRLENIVKYHGYLSDKEIVKYFEECNVGVSYVPITTYYTDVTVTKTMEYLLSGMAVIATNTNWHQKFINKSNGVLIDDSAEAFYDGLSNIFKQLQDFESTAIMKSGEKLDLTKNVEEHIVPQLKAIIKDDKSLI